MARLSHGFGLPEMTQQGGFEIIEINNPHAFL